MDFEREASFCGGFVDESIPDSGRDVPHKDAWFDLRWVLSSSALLLWVLARRVRMEGLKASSEISTQGARCSPGER